MNKIKTNKTFYLDSGSVDILYQFDGEKLWVAGFMDNFVTHFECSIKHCKCSDDSCIIRNPCYQDDIVYIKDDRAKFNKLALV